MYQVSIYNRQKDNNYLAAEATVESPYQAVEQLLDKGKELLHTSSEIAQAFLNEILPIHNLTGLRDPDQVYEMKDAINSGKDIFHDNGLPNIKLVVAPNSKLLLFDGHHTALAYLAAGKKYLSEVPHVIFSGSNFSPVSSKVIAHFFPETKQTAISENWDKFTVNWQADSDKQTELREVASLGELLASLGDRNETSS